MAGLNLRKTRHPGGRLAAALAGACLVATPAAAQQEDWITSLTPGDRFSVGWAHTRPHGDLWFHCAVGADGRPWSPYADGVPPAFTHGLTVELRHAPLGMAAPGTVRADVSLAVDGQRYLLPPMTYRVHGPMAGWFVDLSMGDVLFGDIRDGGTLTVLAGDVPVASHAGGIGPAVAEVTQFCATQYVRAGSPLPDHARPALADLAQPGAPGALSAPEDTHSRMVASVRAHCGEPFDIVPERDAWTTTDLNGDGQPDTILFWGGVGCRTGPYANLPGGGNCGASQCLTTVFVSGTGRGAEPDAAFYTQGPVLDPARPGQVGFAVRIAVCAEAGAMPDCVTWHRWTGTELVRTN